MVSWVRSFSTSTCDETITRTGFSTVLFAVFSSHASEQPDVSNAVRCSQRLWHGHVWYQWLCRDCGARPRRARNQNVLKQRISLLALDRAPRPAWRLIKALLGTDFLGLPLFMRGNLSITGRQPSLSSHQRRYSQDPRPSGASSPALVRSFQLLSRHAPLASSCNAPPHALQSTGFAQVPRRHCGGLFRTALRTRSAHRLPARVLEFIPHARVSCLWTPSDALSRWASFERASVIRSLAEVVRSTFHLRFSDLLVSVLSPAVGVAVAAFRRVVKNLFSQCPRRSPARSSSPPPSSPSSRARRVLWT